jgi:hypothetical protein
MNGGIAPPFLTSALDEGEWSASRPDKTAAGTHSTGGQDVPFTNKGTANTSDLITECRTPLALSGGRTPSGLQHFLPSGVRTSRQYFLTYKFQ